MTDEATLRGWLVNEFSQHVLAGAFRVAADRQNPLRLNLFAAALRELFSHTLHTLAPDTEVTQCSWYTPEPKPMGQPVGSASSTPRKVAYQTLSLPK
jgi:Predicted pPIWI-associating nuclease